MLPLWCHAWSNLSYSPSTRNKTLTEFVATVFTYLWARGLQTLLAQGPHFNGRKFRGSHTCFTSKVCMLLLDTLTNLMFFWPCIVVHTCFNYQLNAHFLYSIKELCIKFVIETSLHSLIFPYINLHRINFFYLFLCYLLLFTYSHKNIYSKRIQQLCQFRLILVQLNSIIY